MVFRDFFGFGPKWYLSLVWFEVGRTGRSLITTLFVMMLRKKAFKQHFPCYHYILCLQGFLLLTHLNFSRVCRSAKLRTPFQ